MVKLESGVGAADSETINRLEDILDQRTDQLQEVQSANSDKQRCIEDLKVESESGARVKNPDTIAGSGEILGQQTDQVKTIEGFRQEDTSQEAHCFSDAGKSSNRHDILDLLSCLIGKRCPV